MATRRLIPNRYTAPFRPEEHPHRLLMVTKKVGFMIRWEKPIRLIRRRVGTSVPMRRVVGSSHGIRDRHREIN